MERTNKVVIEITPSKWIMGTGHFDVLSEQGIHPIITVELLELKEILILFTQPLRSGRIWHKVSF